MIDVQHVHFSYDGKTEVLDDIDIRFDTRPTAIIGQNGSGKTTLVKLLKGLLKPSTGTIIIGGENIQRKSVGALSKQVGLVFQNPNDQLFKSTVLDEVMFGPLNIKMGQKEAKTRSEDALRIVGLYDKRHLNPHDMTMSEKKLVCIASVLSMDTDVVILDEPTIGQDFQGKEKIKGIVQYLKNNGKLVIAVIHDMDFVAEAFTRAIVLYEGKVLLDGHTREVYASRDLLFKAHVEPPSIAKLSHAIGLLETCLTEDEFIACMKKDGLCS